MRLLKYFFYSLLLFFLLVAGGGYFIARLYEDEVKQYFIDQINSYAETEIIVKDFTFSFLRKFPDASLQADEVLIKSPDDFTCADSNFGGSDTLFSGKSVFLQLNIRDFFNGKYNITSIHANDGVVNIFTTSSGDNNYLFWKSNAKDSEDFNLELSELRMENYRVLIDNHLSQLFLKGHLQSLKLSGVFDGPALSLNGSFNMETRQFSGENQVFISNTDIAGRGDLAVSNGKFLLENGVFDFSGLKFQAEGEYFSDESFTEVAINAKNIQPDKLMRFFPDETYNFLDKYNLNGNIDLNALIRGDVEGSTLPAITADFSLENGVLSQKEGDLQISGLSARGSYSNENLRNNTASEVEIDSFTVPFAKGALTGSGRIRNFSNPYLYLNSSGDFNLKKLNEYLGLSGINEIDGRLESDLVVEGAPDNFQNIDLSLLSTLNVRGSLNVSDGFINVEHWKYEADRINGRFIIGETLIAEDLNFYVQDDYFFINGEMENGLGYIMEDDQQMKFNGLVYVPGIDLDNYILKTGDENKSQSSGKAEFPDNLEMNLRFISDNFKFRNFSANKVRGNLSYAQRMFTVNSVSFESMGGDVYGGGIIMQKDNNEFAVQSQVRLQSVNIDNMFHSFNNFSQDFISSNNLKGTLSGELSFSSDLTPELKIVPDKVVADSKIEINNGELIEFEPMLGLSRFIEVSELRHIRFSTLKNEIFIRNEMVTIPQMDINSSAINISGSGIHRFNSEFEYRLRLRLSDVLYGKSRASRTAVSELGFVEDDEREGKNLFLMVEGTPADYDVSYDRRAATAVFREQVEEEKKLLKSILNKEFGWFEKDSIQTEPAGEESPGFRIIWDEDIKQDTLKNNLPDTTGKLF